MQSFVLDRHVPRKQTFDRHQSFDGKPRENLNDQGLHLLVRQLAFSALLLGPAGNGSNANQTMAMASHDISTAAVRRRFSSSSLCHGCSSCVRCCCATIHGKRAIGTCTGQPRGLQS